MGRSKLLLPWGTGTIIDQLLHAWTSSRVAEVVVVIRKDDQDLAEACRCWPVHIVQPDIDPRDMKESVQWGRRHIDGSFSPTSDDRCFVAPADLPGLTAKIIDRMISSPADRSAIAVPLFGDRQGHPALLPWPLTHGIFDLADDDGVNRLVDESRKQFVPFSAEEYCPDVDTPEDYRAAQRTSGT